MKIIKFTQKIKYFLFTMIICVMSHNSLMATQDGSLTAHPAAAAATAAAANAAAAKTYFKMEEKYWKKLGEANAAAANAAAANANSAPNATVRDKYIKMRDANVTEVYVLAGAAAAAAAAAAAGAGAAATRHYAPTPAPGAGAGANKKCPGCFGRILSFRK